MPDQTCRACFGTGKTDGKTCPKCDGMGRVPGPPKFSDIRKPNLNDHLDWLHKSADRMERAKDLPEPARQAFLVKEAEVHFELAQELLNLLKGKVHHDKEGRNDDDIKT
jgi:hypothetical protein